MNVSVRRYAVFISYRHADNKEMGRKWANWLHEALESYEIPPDLIGTINLRGEKVPPSLYPVFRDEEELPADADLSTNICRALENSGLLVVLCSPRAVQSRFVADEIRHFKELGKSHCILALMIDGEPNASEDPVKLKEMGAAAECFPEPLRFGVPSDQDLRKIDWTKRTEPIAADVRPGCRPREGWTSAGAYDEELEREGVMTKAQRAHAVKEYAEQLELAKLKVVAGSLGLPLGVLTQRDKAAQLMKARRRSQVLRRWLAAVAALAIVATVAGFIAWRQYQNADKQYREANRQLERSRYQEGMTWLEKARAAAEKHDKLASLFLAGRALGFHECGRDEQNTAAFEKEFPSLLGGRFQSDAELEKKRMESAIEARGLLLGVGVSGLPLWSSPVLAQDARVEMNDAAFSPDGTLLATAMDDQTVRLWDTVTGREVKSFSGHTEEVSCVDFSPDGLWLASGSEDKTVCLHEVQSGEVRRKLEGHLDWVRRVVFSPDGKKLATCSADKSIKLWDVATGAEIRTLSGHTDEVADIAFSADGTRLISGSSDSTLKLWEIETGMEVKTFSGHEGVVVGVAFAPDGSRVVSVSKDDSIRLWDVSDGSFTVMKSNLSGLTRVAFSPTGRWLALGTNSGYVQIEDLLLQSTDVAMFAQDDSITGLRFSPDGLRLGTSSRDGSVRLWDVDHAEGAFRLTGHTQGVRQLAFSADGVLIASGAEDRLVKVWDLSTRKEVLSLAGHEKEVTSVRFSLDRSVLASGSADQSIRLWDIATARERHVLKGHQADVTHLAFSPDGAQLASVSDDHVLILWRIQDGQKLGQLELGDFDVGRIAFSPDGQRLGALQLGGDGLYDDPEYEMAAQALKVWGSPELKAQSVPPPGSRKEFASWFQAADPAQDAAHVWMASPDQNHIFVAKMLTRQTPPDLVALLDSGLVRLPDNQGPTCSGVQPVSGPPRVYRREDLFSRMVRQPQEDGLRMKNYAQHSQTALAMALWKKVESNASTSLRRDFVITMIDHVKRTGDATLLPQINDLLTAPLTHDSSILGAVEALRRSMLSN